MYKICYTVFMNYWLVKSEASCYRIDDLKRDKKTAWTGVRNYQARNFMQDMHVGDRVLFYHSNGNPENPTGIYGIAQVTALAHVDSTQFDISDDHYDPKSSPEKPIWYCVDIGFVKKLTQPITLTDLKRDPKTASMMVCQQGSRLSVLPVSEKHFEYIVSPI
jgi:predicted RNA-binding protein with PUA-like domain